MTETQRTRALRALSVLLAVIILLCAAATPNVSAKTADEYYENAILFWTNLERTRHGLPELRTSDSLCSAAGVRAEEIARSFSHTRPDGRKWYTVMSDKGLSYKSAAENIAAGQADPCEAVSAWMNSSGHRNNILSSKYSHLGVGYYYTSSASAKHSRYWEQLFFAGSISGSKSGFNVAPTGVSADRSSIGLSVGGTTQLKGIPAPIYATAEISCTSSDPNVVKVTGTQVNIFDIKGCADGTATLRIKCGSYSCSVRVTVGSGVKSVFKDVSPSSVYYSGIVWAAENGIALGYSDGSFRPNSTCTKAQALTFLWRAEGCPAVSGANPFADVSASSPYYKAILWANEKGIAGAEYGRYFLPNSACSRADMVLYIWRSAGSPACFKSAGFADISGLDASSRTAVNWAVSEGIVTGYSDSIFRPDETCTRAHIVTFLYRYCN